MTRIMLVAAAFALLIGGSAAATTLMDAWNPDQATGTGIFPYPSNYAIKYIPAASYRCAKIEFWGAGSPYMDGDAVTVRVETDLADQPSGEVLAAVTTPVLDGPPNIWMGLDFPTPVDLTAGVTYWIISLPMPFSPINWAIAGDQFPTMFSGDALHWNPANPQRWKARFWGDPIVATDAATWSAVKALFD
jgi:hypothetical protein